MGKCVVNNVSFVWNGQEDDQDYFKTVDVSTMDLPVPVVDAPVIVHTIEPPCQANTKQRQDMVRGTCPTVRLSFWTATDLCCFRFPVHAKELLLLMQ